MTIEEERQEQERYRAQVEQQILDNLTPNGAEVSFRRGQEQVTLSLLELPERQNLSHIVLAIYKRKPQVGNTTLIEPIAHIDMDINSSTKRATLGTSVFFERPDLIAAAPNNFRAMIEAFREREYFGEKVNAMEVASAYRGRGYGRLVYALGKAVAGKYGVDAVDITGDITGGFYEKHGAHPRTDVGMSWVKTTSITFNAAERNALGALKVVRDRRQRG